MKINKIAEAVFRKLLRESQDEREERGRRRLAASEGMAVLVQKDSSYVVAVLYDPGALLKNAEAAAGPPRTAGEVIVSEIILGAILATKPDDPCNDAWEVGMSAVKNKGDGGLIYGLAYALTPSGVLTADRRSVSQAAQKGWSTTKTRQEGTPFDDALLPREERRTPDDPTDDCRLHRPGDKCKGGHIDLDSLNRSYVPEGWEKRMLKQLQQAHEQTVAQLDPAQAQNISKNLFLKASAFFSRYYA